MALHPPAPHSEPLGYPSLDPSSDEIMAIPPPPPYTTPQQQSPPHLSSSSSSSSSSSFSGGAWISNVGTLVDKIKYYTTSMPSKKQAVQLDRRSIDHGMKLVSIAADEYDRGNETNALNIYFAGLENILMALPNTMDIKTRQSLRERLSSIEQRVGLSEASSLHSRQQQNQRDNAPFSRKRAPQQQIQQQMQTNPPAQKENAYFDATLFSRLLTAVNGISSIRKGTVHKEHHRDNYYPHTQQPSSYAYPCHSSHGTATSDPVHRFKRLSQTVIHTSVACAVAVKRSPLPDLLYFMFGYFLQFLVWMDTQYHLMQKAQYLGIELLKYFIEINEKYRLHEYLSEMFYMLLSASLKAAIAYKEAPSYGQDPAAQTVPLSKEHRQYNYTPYTQCHENQYQYENRYQDQYPYENQKQCHPIDTPTSYYTSPTMPPPPSNSTWMKTLWQRNPAL
ncbi:hypothetical protein BDF14DRAFT_1877479 [Spinellus fusiger]|nr:hypothetical protein BDF14DRAFT_1877479 [Spinellus fusiger]